jgi:hypothetical protein
VRYAVGPAVEFERFDAEVGEDAVDVGAVLSGVVDRLGDEDSVLDFARDTVRGDVAEDVCWGILFGEFYESLAAGGGGGAQVVEAGERTVLSYWWAGLSCEAGEVGFLRAYHVQEGVSDAAIGARDGSV